MSFSRVLILIPPPHGLVQFPSLHLPHLQLIAVRKNLITIKLKYLHKNENKGSRIQQFYAFLPVHGEILHTSTFKESPKQDPPFVSLTSFVLVLFLVPVPQVLEHFP